MAQLEKHVLTGYPRDYALNDVIEISIDRANNKLVVMPSSDGEYDEAASREGIPGKLLIISHGNERFAGGNLKPVQLAQIIKTSRLWRPGMWVIHDACNIGKFDDGFAQMMSNELGVAYTGPTSYSWRKWQIIGGGSFIADTAVGGNFANIFRLGSWRTFYPKYPELNSRLRR